MHRKEKGNLGELKVAADLVSKGYPVFTELGDNSKVDLIALVANQCIKIQVKAYESSKGSVKLSSHKAGPNYRFQYTLEQLDLFAVYVIDYDVILYVNADELIDAGWMVIRMKPREVETHKQQARMYEDYLEFMGE